MCIRTVYHKRGKICWAKVSRFSQFSGVPQKVFREYKYLSLIILNNEYLCTAFGQGNTKIFPRKLRWRWNSEYLAQRIFPHLQYISLHDVAWFLFNGFVVQFKMCYRNFNRVDHMWMGQWKWTKWGHKIWPNFHHN